MNAHQNPFHTDRLHSLGVRWPDDMTQGDVVRLLDSVGWRGAIVGPHGSGKTQMLHELGHWLQSQKRDIWHLFLNESRKTFSVGEWHRMANEDVSQTILLIDGAEQLSRSQWRKTRQLCERAAGFIVTAHDETLMPALLKTATDQELLQILIHELVSPHRELEGMPLPDAGELFRKHCGNLRDALRECFDLYARLELPALAVDERPPVAPWP